MVYVLDFNGQPLMPTCRYGKVRRLLKQGKAKVVKRCPFAIQLLYDSTTYTQPVTLGVDAGAKHVGLSATTDTKELYSGEVLLRTDVVSNLSSRLQFRRTRRNRKTRYRQARFNNRVKTKHKGWLAPSIKNKIHTHIVAIGRIYDILPVTKLIVEVASFDTQLLKATELELSKPEGTDYQQGDMLGFWNVRQYVFFRDDYTCQHCKGKSKDKILNVHHVESRKTGGNAPNNLVTLCETCHKAYHKGTINLNLKRGKSFREAVFMGIMRWSLYNELKELYPNVNIAYGYITKNTRIIHGLDKSHRVDARCITGNPMVTPCNEYFLQKKTRCHNRQIHKATVSKGGYRKLNQTSYITKGFRLFDKVLYNDIECFIFGRRATGYFDVRLLSGEKLSAGVSYKKLKLLETRKNLLIERKAV
jgi:hypothetical protein